MLTKLTVLRTDERTGLGEYPYMRQVDCGAAA